MPYAYNAIKLEGKSSSDFLLANKDSDTLFNKGSTGQFLTKTQSGLEWTNNNVNATTIAAALGYAPASPSSIAALTLKANNLSDLTSATEARTNLGLGSLATKSIVNLNTDISGTLLPANGGSPWISTTYGFYLVSNTSIGSSTVLVNTKLYIENNTSSHVLRLNNTNNDGYGLRLDVSGTNPNIYALNILNTNGSMFMVKNNGLIGIGTTAPSSRLHVASGSDLVAPLKLSKGELLSTPASGAIEYDGDYLYITDNANNRHKIATTTMLNKIDNISEVNSTSNISLIPVGSVIVSSSIASNSSSTGALTIKGGLGVSGSINAGGNIATLGSLTASSIYGGNLSNGHLIIESTSNSNKGHVIISPNSSGNGYVGIGTITPNAKLNVVTSDGFLPVAKFESTAPTGQKQGVFINAGSTASDTAFSVKSSMGRIPFIIRGDGEVGIGTPNPTANLELINTTSFTASHTMLSLTRHSGDPSATSILTLQKSRGTSSTPTSINAGDLLGQIRFNGYGTTSNYVTGAVIEAIMANVGSPSTVPTDLVFKTTNNIGILAERFRINQDGNIGIGTASATAKLTVSGTIRSTTGGYEFPDGTIQQSAALNNYQHINLSCTSSTDPHCSVVCPNGKKILSGGCSLSDATDRLIASYPSSNTSWKCTKKISSSTITAYAICF